jgi:hypothetical protein
MKPEGEAKRKAKLGISQRTENHIKIAAEANLIDHGDSLP